MKTIEHTSTHLLPDSVSVSEGKLQPAASLPIFLLFQQQLKRVRNDFSLSALFLFRWQLRVARRIRDRLSAGNSGRTDRLGDRRNRTNMSSRDSCLLNLFYYRCTATCTGPSGAGQDDPLNTCCKQVFSHLLTHSGCIGNRSRVSCSGQQIRIDLSDDLFLL